jgi:VWA domain-containing protein
MFQRRRSVSIGIVLDASGSMGANVGLMKEAVIQFVRGANLLDEYALLKFQGRPRVVLPFTLGTNELLHSADSIQAGGSTALFDAVHPSRKCVTQSMPERRCLSSPTAWTTTAATRKGKQNVWSLKSTSPSIRSTSGSLRMETGTPSSAEIRTSLRRFRIQPGAKSQPRTLRIPSASAP